MITNDRRLAIVSKEFVWAKLRLWSNILGDAILRMKSSLRYYEDTKRTQYLHEARMYENQVINVRIELQYWYNVLEQF